MPTPSLSGPSLQQTHYVTTAGQARVDFLSPNAAPACLPLLDGTEFAPALIPFTGWWTGNLCSYNHTAWSLLPVKASRSFTIEVTALDESSLATPSKMMPVIGLWNATDATGTLPSIALTPSAFNTSSTGMTAISTQTSQPQFLRIAILDQRGDGRPDFAYRARVLYADSVTPSTVPAKGAPIIITGIGFRPGNTVSINGVSASVSSWTSTAITAVAPPLLHNTRPIAATVAVQDLSTGCSTSMTGALNYQAALPELTLLSAPSGIVIARTPAATPFAVKAISGDGVTPLANVSITLSTTLGQVRFEACGSSTCTLTTGSSGTVTSAVTPLIPGLVTLSTISSIGDITAGFIVLPRIQTITAIQPQLYLAQSSVLTWNPQVTLADNAVSTAGLPVQWTPLSGHITLTPPISSTNQQSLAKATATAGPLDADSQATASACAWNDSPPSTCATFAISGIGNSALQLSTASGDQQSIDAASAFAPVVLLVTDSTGHPVAGATVSIRQTLSPGRLHVHLRDAAPSLPSTDPPPPPSSRASTEPSPSPLSSPPPLPNSSRRPPPPEPAASPPSTCRSPHSIRRTTPQSASQTPPRASK